MASFDRLAAEEIEIAELGLRCEFLNCSDKLIYDKCDVSDCCGQKSYCRDHILPYNHGPEAWAAKEKFLSRSVSRVLDLNVTPSGRVSAVSALSTSVDLTVEDDDDDANFEDVEDDSCKKSPTRSPFKKKRNTRRQKSSIWMHFTVKDRFSYCNYCNPKQKSEGGGY